MNLNPLSIAYGKNKNVYTFPSIEFSVTGNTASVLSTIYNTLANAAGVVNLIIPSQDIKQNVLCEIDLRSICIASVEDKTTNPWPLPITNYIFGGLSTNNYVKIDGAPLKQRFFSNMPKTIIQNAINVLSFENIEILHSIDLSNLNAAAFAEFSQADSSQLFLYVNPVITYKWQS